MRKAFWFVLFVVGGFLVALFVMPSTRWIPFLQWDVLRGRWINSNNSIGVSELRYMEPSDALLFPRPNTDEAEFLALITPPPNRPQHYTQEQFDGRIRALYEIARKSGRPDYYAQMVRVGSQASTIRTEPIKGKIDEKQAKWQRGLRELLLKGCLEAEKLDPENAFFPFIAVSAYYSLNRRAEADAALLRASRMTKYNDYVRLEPELRLAQVERELGYRGEPIRAWILANILFYHSANIRQTGRVYVDSGDLEFRVAVARVAALMMQQDTSMIGLFVARSMFAHALRAEPKKNMLPGEVPLSAAEELEASLPGDQGLVRAANQFNALTAKMPKDGFVSEDTIDLLNMRPAVTGAALGALISLLVMGLVVYLRSVSLKFDAVAPLLIFLAALPLEVAGLDRSNFCLAFTLVALLAIPALWPKLRPLVYKLGWLAAGAGGVAALGSMASVDPMLFSSRVPGSAVLPVLMLIALALLYPLHMLSRRKEEAPVWMAATGLVVLPVIAAILWALTVANRPEMASFLMVWLGMVGLACAVPVVRREQLFGAFTVALATLGVGYAYVVFQDLAWNARAGAAVDALLNEADRVRKESKAF